MKNFLIFTLFFFSLFIVRCADAVTVPFSAFGTNEFNVSVPNNTISINTTLFPTNGSSLYDSNGAALYQAGLSSNYSLTLSQNGTNESLQIGLANSNLTYQVGLANTNLSYAVGLASTNLSNIASNALCLAVLNGTIPAGSATNVTGLQTNSTTGNSATSTLASNVTLLASAPAISQYESNLVFWYNPRAIITTNNLFGVPTWADSSLNGITGYSLGNAQPIYSANGMNGSPCWLMHANFNPATGAAPTIYYAITNAAWNQSAGSNFCLFTVFQDILELSQNTTPSLVTGDFLFTIGTNVQFFCNPIANNSSGSLSCLGVQVNHGQILIGLQHHFTPNVLCIRCIGGICDYWLNGVLVFSWPFTGGSAAPSSLGSVITIGSSYSGSGLFGSGNRSFCGNQSDFLLFTNQMPNAGVASISSYLMQQNNIGNGTAINLWGDSIMAGSFSLSQYNNYLALVQYNNPHAFVTSYAISGLVSGQVLQQMTNSGAAQPPNTGKVIDIWYAGVNDAINGVTLVTWESNTTNAMNYSHAQGHKFDICELASYAGETGNTITRAAQTTFIDGLAGQVDGIMPFAHDPIVGTNGASVQSGTPYYANSIHFNSAGYFYTYQADMAPILQAQLSGNSTNYGPANFTGNGSGLTNYSAVNLTTNGANPEPSQGQVLAVQGNGSITFTNPASGGGNVNSNTVAIFSQTGATNATATNQFAGGIAANSLNISNAINAASAIFTGTVQANLFSGSGASLTSLPGANVTGTISLANIPGGVLTNNQVGAVNLATNNTLTVSNLVAGGNVTATVNVNGAFLVGSTSAQSGNAMLISSGNTVQGAILRGVASAAVQLGIAAGGSFLGGALNGNGQYATNFVGISTQAGVHTPSSVTVGTSPFSYTNLTPSAQECYFSGGVSAYAIAKNGVGVYASLVGNDYLILQPTNYCTITWSVNAPTMYTNSW